MAEDAYDTARRSQAGTARRLRRRRTRHAAESGRPTGSLHLSSGSDTQRRGHAAEQRASEFLQARGLCILAANLRCRAGEIDLVARDAGVLVFIEVRQRDSPQFGGAAASVNRPKQARLIRTARYFLPRLARHCFEGRTPPCRFDVVAQEGAEMRWIRDAFGWDDP
ncbi:hypothetical protein CDEF62S_05777 [Castellaniella defragrans]